MFPMVLKEFGKAFIRDSTFFVASLVTDVPVVSCFIVGLGYGGKWDVFLGLALRELILARMLHLVPLFLVFLAGHKLFKMVTWGFVVSLKV